MTDRPSLRQRDWLPPAFTVELFRDDPRGCYLNASAPGGKKP